MASVEAVCRFRALMRTWMKKVTFEGALWELLRGTKVRGIRVGKAALVAQQSWVIERMKSLGDLP